MICRELCLILILFSLQMLSGAFSSSNDSKLSGEKIVNGQIVSSRTSFPYHVAMLLKKIDAMEFSLCGGSIISQRGILTAGHCLFRTDFTVIIMGTHDLAANDSDIRRVRVNSSDFILHPNFNYHDASLDIAIVRIREAIEFSDYIQPVEILSKHLFEETFVGEISTTTGHGQYCDANCGPSSVLRFSKNRIMSKNECRQHSYYHNFPTETQICISTSEHGVGSSCRGDSGSGLTIQRNNVTILVGLSSFGDRKCEEGKPAVFTRLTSSLVSWVWRELSAAEKDNN